VLNLATGRARFALLAVCLVPFILLVIAQWSTGPLLTFGEHAQYLLHAQALLRGDNYTHTGYIFSAYNPSVGFVAQPPGLTLTLLPIIAVAGVHSDLPRVLMAVSAAAFLLLAGWYWVKHEGVWAGAAVALMTGVSLEFSYATNVPLPDVGLAALLWGLILLADEPTPVTARRLLGITLLGFAAIAYRPSAVALLPAMLLFAVLENKPRQMLFFAPVGLWIVVLLVIVTVANPMDELTGSLPSDVGFLVRLFWTNLTEYPRLVLDAHLYPFASNRSNDIYHIGTGVLTLVGLLTWAGGHRRTFVGAFTLVFAFLLLIAPARTPRNAWVFYPLLVLGLVRGLELLIAWVGPKWAVSRRGAVAFAIVAVISIAGAINAARRPTPPTLVDNPDTKALFDTLRTMRETRPVRAMFSNPRVLVLETGVPAMASLEEGDSLTFQELKRARITHVVVGDLGLQPHLQARIDQFIRRHPEAFTEVYKNASFEMWEYKP
jgi:hypothetical protein